MSAAAPAAKKAKVGEDDAKAKSHEAKHSEPDQESTPGHEDEMDEKPRFEAKWYRGSGKLEGKVALITGGDSGIGRAVAVLFAREGCKVAINYLSEEQSDAEETKKWVEEKERGACLLLPGDLRDSKVCSGLVTKTVEHYGKLDILVNNAGQQHVVKDFVDIEEDQIVDTFRTNIIAMMLVTKEALKHLPEKTGAIINTTSVTAFRGNPKLVDYSSTKGAISAFTRSLATQLGPKGIRVNQVAPGPIWTPLIPSTFSKDHRAKWGKDTPLGRIGQPDECSPAYVFLASQDSSYFTGQTLHPNGGSVVNA